MMYPFEFPQAAMATWQLQFVGACRERAWASAVALLEPRAPLQPDMVTGSWAFAEQVAVLVTEAPASVVEILRKGGMGPLNGSVGAWRTQVVGELLGDHLTNVMACALAKEFLPAHHHLVAGIRLRAREIGQEAMIAAAFTVLCENVGETECFLETNRPDLAGNPAAISPAFGDVAASVPLPATNYHPQLLASVVASMVEAGASDTLIALAIRGIALHARWPSWRALAQEIAQSASILGPRAEAVIKLETEIPAGAKAYLEFGCRGLAMPNLPPKPSAEDVGF